MTSRRTRLTLGLLALTALVAASAHCVGSPSAPIETAFPAPAVDESAPGSSTTVPLAPADGGAGEVDAAPLSGDPHGPADQADNPVARLMRTTDEHDRRMLAEVERETGRAPSPAIGELVQRRHAGASQGELEQLIAGQLHGDVRERMAAQRWLRAVFPNDAAPAAGSPRPGSGGGERRLAPIEPAP